MEEQKTTSLQNSHMARKYKKMWRHVKTMQKQWCLRKAGVCQSHPMERYLGICELWLEYDWIVIRVIDTWRIIEDHRGNKCHCKKMTRMGPWHVEIIVATEHKGNMAWIWRMPGASILGYGGFSQPTPKGMVVQRRTNLCGPRCVSWILMVLSTMSLFDGYHLQCVLEIMVVCWHMFHHVSPWWLSMFFLGA